MRPLRGLSDETAPSFLRQEMHRGLLGEDSPPHMHQGLKLYLEQGIQPGGFLLAVLSNDLMDACLRADHINRHCLPDYIDFLMENAPAECWGSKKKVDAWIAKHRRVEES